MPILDAPIRLGNILVERGYLTVDQIHAALADQHQSGKNKLLGEIVVDLEFCTEDQVVECLASGYGVPYAKLEARLCDPKVTDLLPRDFIERHLVFPLFCLRGVLTVAVSEPSNLFLIDELRNQTDKEIQIVAASTKDIRRMITSLPDSKVFVIDDIIEDSDQTEVTLIENAIEDIGDVEEVSGQSPVIHLGNNVINTVGKEVATGTHIEPGEHSLRGRNPIDGNL